MKPGFQKIMMISTALIFTIHFFKKMCQSRPLFHLFSSFQTHITIFSQQIGKCEKMSIQYTGLGFELTTFESPLITTRPGLTSMFHLWAWDYI